MLGYAPTTPGCYGDCGLPVTIAASQSSGSPPEQHRADEVELTPCSATAELGAPAGGGGMCGSMDIGFSVISRVPETSEWQ